MAEQSPYAVARAGDDDEAPLNREDTSRPPAVVAGSPTEDGGSTGWNNSSFLSVVGLGPLPGDVPQEALTQVNRNFAIKGVLFTLAGVVAIVFPLLFGLAVEQLLAWLLVLGGGVTLVQFLMMCGTPGTTSFLLLGALHLIVGLWLLLKPIEGLAALTLVLSGWFIVHGALKFVLAFQICHLTTWPVVLISGLLSIGLGITILALTPTYGLKLLGIVIGADLLSTGVAVLLISCLAFIKRGRYPQPDTEAAREQEPAREPLINRRGSAP